MMPTVIMILAIAALIGTIVSLMGKCPLSVPVLLLAIIACLRSIPLGG